MPSQDDIREIRRSITVYKHRLQKLKKQRARLGLNTPPEILIDIEDVEAEIEKLQEELEKEKIEDKVESTHTASASIPAYTTNKLEHKVDAVLEKSPEIVQLKKLILRRERHLQELKKQQALKGINTPADIVLAIEDTEAEIQRLQIELQKLESQAEEKN